MDDSGAGGSVKHGDPPRHFHFFLGSPFARVPEVVLLPNKRPQNRLKHFDITQALAYMHERAAQYKRPFNIEVAYTPGAPQSLTGVPWLEATLAARRVFGAEAGPYRLINRSRQGWGVDGTLYHATSEQLLHTFETRIMRYIMGEETAFEHESTFVGHHGMPGT